MNVSLRCGLSRNAFQIRPTVDGLSPAWRAIDARDQWVASFRRLLQSVDDHLLHLLVGDRPRRARPRLVHQSLQPPLHEPGPPLAHRQTRHPKPLGYRGITRPVRTRRNPRPQRQLLRARPPPGPPLQRLPLLAGQHQLGLRPSTSRLHRRRYTKPGLESPGSTRSLLDNKLKAQHAIRVASSAAASPGVVKRGGESEKLRGQPSARVSLEGAHIALGAAPACWRVGASGLVT